MGFRDMSFLWPYREMNFWNIDDPDRVVNIRWSHNCFEDYKKLAYDFYVCGCKTFEEVINSGHDNVKSDMWFLTGVFLMRQSLELGLKSLICRICINKKLIQNAFEDCCHDLSRLFECYYNLGSEIYLNEDEKRWMVNYLASLEEVDSKSDMFRFPFGDEFLSRYRDKFLDNVDVANNLVQAFCLVYKCIQKGKIAEKDKFNHNYIPEFFVFASHGIGNCYLWQRISDEGFHVKITGYNEVIDYIYNNQNISDDTKLYPLMFMCRNTIELCLKRLFYSRVEKGVSLKIFNSKRRSHLIKKDLWKNVKPVIVMYAQASGNDLEIIEIVDKALCKINDIDKNGDIFRYPTSYSLEYKFDNVKIDISNIYKYLKSLINFLDGCDSMLDEIAEYESDMKAEYAAEMSAYIDW